MAASIDIELFLQKFLRENPLLLDVRSENEFAHAHIPGAVNIPLLNNEHRHLVGIEYKQKGREAAVALGFELVGPHFHHFIKKAHELSQKKEVMIYCWRGGMRSSIMAWILSMAGFNVTLLKGGYKFYRRFMLLLFSRPYQLQVLGGHTGCGKTQLLNEIGKMGEQVLDLESFANHKGSAFGSLGMEDQPSTEYFENLLGMKLFSLDKNKITWAEAESHSIGKVKIPDDFFSQLQQAPLIEVLAPREYRINRIKEEYCVFSKEQLAACTGKLKKRLGNLRLAEALQALEEGRLSDWLEILLDYYDKTYKHSISERNPLVKAELEIHGKEISSEIANKLISLSSTIYQKKAV